MLAEGSYKPGFLKMLYSRKLACVCMHACIKVETNSYLIHSYVCSVTCIFKAKQKRPGCKKVQGQAEAALWVAYL